MNEFPDQEARDIFATELDRNFAVSAGAGAGKTTAIASRIASLAIACARAADDRLSRLVVVTYTRAAAAELRARAQAAVQRALADATGLAPEVRHRAMAQLPRAFFGTIHSFCIALLRVHGGTLGLPPGIDRPSDAQQAAWDEKFAQSEAAAALPISDDLLRFVRYDDVLQLARTFPAAHLDQPMETPPGPAPRPDFEALRAITRAGNAEQNIEATKIAVQRWAREFDFGTPFVGLPKCLTEAREFAAAFDSALAPLHGWIEASLLAATQQLARLRQQQLLAEGWLGYDEQVSLAHALLRDSGTLDRMRAEGRIVLLDEAQDTSAEMFEILAEITRPIGAACGSWPEGAGAGPEAGRFTFVGDEQQSIYRDKADPADFLRYAGAAAEADRLTFEVTMRCAEAVCVATNALFAGPKVPILPGGPPFRALVSRPNVRAGAVWRLPLLKRPVAEDKTDWQMILEVRQLASWLAARCPADLGVARWNEIALIAPRKEWLAQAATALAGAGVPARQRSEKRIAREIPARSWPIALLHVLLEPWDRFELIGVLRDIYGVSDLLLAAQHEATGLQFAPEIPADALVRDGRLGAALTQLQDLRRKLLRPDSTLLRALDTVLDETQLRARLSAIGQPAESLSALRYAAATAGANGVPLREWVRGQVQLLESQPEEGSDDVDAVQLLTTQKSKGLEWPMVVLFGLARTIGERHEQVPFRWDIAAGAPPGIRLPGQKDAGEKSERVARRDAELRRFVYVAMTRARRLLILTDSAEGFYLGQAKSAPNSAQVAVGLATLIRSLPEAGGDPLPLSDAPVQGPVPFEPAVPDDVLSTARLQSLRRPRLQRPSRFAHPESNEADLIEEAEPAPLENEEEERPLLEPEGGKEYGTWWHEACARLPWTRGPSARHAWYVAERAAIERTKLRRRGHAELERLLASAELPGLSAEAVRVLVEVPYTHPLPGDPPTWTEGAIDAVIIHPDATATILDWKTDRARAGENEDQLLERLAAAYAPQLAAYATALQEGIGLQVRGCAIYATAPGRVVWCGRV